MKFGRTTSCNSASTNQRDHVGTHAVILGGSMAGMLAARILSEHFDRVTIIERDRYPDAAVSRRGVPQARHLHVLLERGRLILERFFPGLTAAMIGDGAHLVDTAADFALLNPAGWAVQFASGICMLACSRDLVDWHVRRRLESLPQVRFMPETDVTGLIPNADGTGIAGVTVRRHAPSENDSTREHACKGDFVVDASGRGSRTPKWLEALGYPRVEETVVNAHLGYASRVFRQPTGLPDGCKGIFLQAAPPRNNRAGVAFPIEGDRWIVTVSGGGRDYPTADEAGFLEFVRSLRSSILFGSIKDAEPLSPIHLHRGGENRVRHFERMSRWPERFVALGDAVCTFNPVYAQGMTTAALNALALDDCLNRRRAWLTRGRLTGLARRVQQKIARLNSVPWMFATSEDLRYSTTEGAHASWSNRLMHRYIDHVLRLNTTSAAVRRRSLSVFHMLKSPATLFHPGTVARVLWEWTKVSMTTPRSRARPGRAVNHTTSNPFERAVTRLAGHI